ncbi:MAG: TetR/AcrR family transcriptional regulator [Actinomycetia bacterium]|nr:TetR/AcrR family transcriptional regulator [Actinomycetes bacterium]MCP4224995.1 TetR/AcrR family transcriptional regulator [Actinomycetes bacterium]MCP5034623.1 TetR/AcrR family transcriptional regulator [Actinomycetes bacterium]
MTDTVVRYASNRRDDLIEAAAVCFSRDGFDAASIRGIAAEVGMQTASIYYHFASKDDLLLAVHERGLRFITEAALQAIEGVEPGWDKVEAACTAHLRALLGGEPIFKAIMAPLPSTSTVRPQIVEMRDSYEQVFRDLLDELDLPEGTDRRHLRLLLLGAMNWSFTWFQGRRSDIDAFARSIVDGLRSPLDIRR